MKADNGIITYSSKADYLGRRPEIAKKLAEKSLDLGLSEGAEKAAKATVDGLKDNVTVSEAAKSEALKNNSKGLKEDVKQKLKEVPEKIPEKIKDKVVEGKSAGEHLIGQAGSALARAVTGGALPGVSLPSFGSAKPVSEVAPSKANQVDKNKEGGKVNTPGIFFIRGFSLNPFDDGSEGLGSMSKNIPTSKVFSWSEEDSVIEEINKRPHTQPVILVGHGMGGDTAVSIANKLNSMDHGFRRVDLLVTLDSVGTDNDIIPQNVRENYNLISDQDFLFNDGPNIARKKHLTKVTNELLEANHNELETSPEIQFLVYEKINSTLMNAISRRDFREALQGKLIDSHRLSSLKPNLSA